MSDKVVRLALLLALVTAFVLLMAVRLAKPMSLSGRWRDQSPAALLYEFRDDGSVWLIRGDQDLPVFHYEIARDAVEFYDGMGRQRVYRYSLYGDRLFLRELDGNSLTAEYRREP
jgi:hypothetical protein